MEHFCVREVEIHLADLLRRVQSGESLTITQDGRAVAQLIPATSGAPRDRIAVIEDLLNFGKGRPLGGMHIREMVDEGRRY